METVLKVQTCPGKSAAWYNLRVGPHLWQVRGDISGEAVRNVLAPGLQRPSDFLKEPDARGAVFNLGGFIAKRYRASTWGQRVKAVLRGSQAQRAARWAGRLRALGVRTIEPVAIIFSRARPWESCLLSEHIAARRSIHEYAQKAAASLERRWLVRDLAEVMSRLHNAAISHGDAHLANFIVENHPRRLVLVDLDSLRQRWRLSLVVAARDLKRLLDYSPASRREHLRFLVLYARGRTPRVSSRELLRSLHAQRRGPGPLADAR